MNNHLARQLRKLGIDGVPDATQWEAVLGAVSVSYDNAEEDRDLLERSLTMMSEEMQERWKALSQSEAFVQLIYNSSADSILACDQKYEISSCNATFSRVFGITKAEVCGRPLADFLNFAEFPAEQGRRVEMTVRRHDGSGFLADCQYRIFDFKGAVYRVFFLRDLTAERDREAVIENQRAKIGLSAKMAALGEMAGGIAHEINTPLSILSLYAEVMGEAVSSGSLELESLRKTSEAISETAMRIGKIVQGLRSFARDGSGDPLVEADVGGLIADVLILCQERFRNNRVDLRVDPIPEALRVRCRQVEVVQVLLNLLNNAYDATEGQASRWVEVRLRESEDHVDLMVVDGGPGVQPEHRKKLMNPFFTTKPVGRGTGLGLSISAGLMKGQGGELFFDAEAERTTFVVRFPRVQ